MVSEKLFPGKTSIANIFLTIDPPISKEDFVKIGELPYWEQKLVTPEILSKTLFWHFDPKDPNHVGQILTAGGQSQRLSFVATRYLEKSSFLQNKYPTFVTKVEGIRKALALGVDMPPLLLVSGRRPGSPMSLVDGNFRALALMVQSLREPNREWSLKAFIGRKSYFWENHFLK
jgi:hypothetical protein